MKNFRRFIENFIPDKNTNWDYIESLIWVRELKKGEIISHQDKVEDYVSFISHGIARIYHEGDWKQTTVDIRFENNFVSSYDSFLSRLPSKYTVDAVTDIKLLSIHYDDIQKIYKQTESGNLIARKITEQNFLIKEKRQFNLLTKTPTEYYQFLIENFPKYIDQIPLNYIASYIGVTPQALSRIRKNLNL
ncbi:Crp/Fnr family transcriptional regulator [Chryseobacterium sp. KACC 21268]|nr:Crp/Fnr family transcriptional regulator [Chryseobacterium sp. KACC 21268]